MDTETKRLGECIMAEAVAESYLLTNPDMTLREFVETMEQVIIESLNRE